MLTRFDLIPRCVRSSNHSCLQFYYSGVFRWYDRKQMRKINTAAGPEGSGLAVVDAGWKGRLVVIYVQLAAGRALLLLACISFG